MKKSILFPVFIFFFLLTTIKAQSILSFGNINSINGDTVDVELIFNNKSGNSLAGWQFDISVKLLASPNGIYGGNTATNAWTVSNNTNDSSRALGFYFSPPTPIPADSSVLTNVVFTNPNNNSEACLYGIVMSDPNGVAINTIAESCLSLVTTSTIEKKSLKKKWVYPSPSNGIVQFRGIDLTKGKLSVINLKGQLLLEKENTLSEIDLSHLRPGLYFLEWKEKDKHLIEKLIIE